MLVYRNANDSCILIIIDHLAKLLAVLIICKFSGFFIKDFIYFFSERRGGREKERERNIDVREKHQPAASHTHPDRSNVTFYF